MIIYLGFCLATAIFSLLKHWIPIINRLKINGIDNELTDSPWLSYIVYFCLAFIVSPLLIFTVFSSSIEETFVEGMYDTLEENQT